MKIEELIKKWKPRGKNANRGEFNEKFAERYGVTLRKAGEFVTGFTHSGELSLFGSGIVDFLLSNKIYRVKA